MAFIIITNIGVKMKVSLASKKVSVTEYGFIFDDKGICECDAKVAQSLIDTGILIEIKATKAKK